MLYYFSHIRNIECIYVLFIRRVSTIYHLTRSFLSYSFTFGLVEVRDVEVLCVLSASHAQYTTDLGRGEGMGGEYKYLNYMYVCTKLVIAKNSIAKM